MAKNRKGKTVFKPTNKFVKPLLLIAYLTVASYSTGAAANTITLASDSTTHTAENGFNFSKTFSVPTAQYTDIYFNFIAAGDYGRDFDEEGIFFLLDGFLMFYLGIGQPYDVEPEDDYYYRIVNDSGTLVSFSYTTEIPNEHYTIYGSFLLNDTFFNPLLSDSLLTVDWRDDDTGTTHIIGDEYPEFVSWEITASVVPIPATAWLFISGVIGLIGLARRKV
jgi:hypothetical protein